MKKEQVSHTFDPDWYRSYYKDVDASGLEPLEHYAKIGSRLSRLCAPEQLGIALNREGCEAKPGIERSVLSEQMKRRVNELLSWYGTEATNRAGLHATSPLISIIIPVHNNFEVTCRCLQAIAAHPPSCDYEVIIVDDASSDATNIIFPIVPRLRTLRLRSNQGFVHACNAGSELAIGKYLYFLNNDTEVMFNAIDELIRTMQSDSDIGIVGSKLVYPDGRLQEAGAIIWQDGSGWNYGHLGDAAAPEYNFLRESDYVSGASLLISKELFFAVGQFDREYVPAYFEDVDLAYKVRSFGKKVIYQPFSVVVHHEGLSCGTDISSGIKSYQPINQRKFYSRWKHVLKGNRPNGKDSEKEASRGKLKVLFIDALPLTPRGDAGSAMSYNFINSLISLNCAVTFIANERMRHPGDLYIELQKKGVQCIYEPFYPDAKSYIAQRGCIYDVIVLSRYYVAQDCLSLVRECCKQAAVVFNSIDLHYVREAREARLKALPYLIEAAESTKSNELAVVRECDVTIVVSTSEQAELHRMNIGKKVLTMPLLCYECAPFTDDFNERKGIMFIGGFRHSPNLDAVEYFLRNIWPLVAEAIPDVPFFVIGGDFPDELQASLETENVFFVGAVSNPKAFFKKSRLSVAPLRFGAGIKGKVLESVSYGLPVVGTPIAFEGTTLAPGVGVVQADDPRSFANAIIEIYSKETIWSLHSRSCCEYAASHLGKAAVDADVGRLLSDLNSL